MRAGAAPGSTQRYEDFRKGVFEGSAVTQHFRDVNIAQDRQLADVTLVIVNESDGGSSWGWKTLLLLKVDSRKGG